VKKVKKNRPIIGGMPTMGIVYKVQKRELQHEAPEVRMYGQGRKTCTLLVNLRSSSHIYVFSWIFYFERLAEAEDVSYRQG
jgi:hypothetical protein